METTYLEKLFKISKYWAAYETIVYNILMTAHTIGLFLFLPKNGYGQMGMVLSSIYMIAYAATMGNDISTGLILQEATKRSIKEALTTHALYSMIVGAMGILYIGYIIGMQGKVDSMLLLLSMILLVAEVTRKISKSLLLATKHFKQVAHTEIIALAGSISGIWIIIFIYSKAETKVLLIPIIISTAITAYRYTRMLRCFYQELSDGQASDLMAVLKIKLRAVLNGAQSILFSSSGSSLIEVIMLQQKGYGYAGGIKVTNTIIQSCTSILERAYGTTSTLLFAKTSKSAQGGIHALKMIYRSLVPVVVIGLLLVGLLISVLLVKKGLIKLLPTVLIYLLIQAIVVLSGILERYLIMRGNRLASMMQGGAILLVLTGYYAARNINYPTAIGALLGTRLTLLIIFVGIVVWQQLFSAQKESGPSDKVRAFSTEHASPNTK